MTNTKRATMAQTTIRTPALLAPSTTMRCANGHPPIDHDEFYCPLCCELEDHADLWDGLHFAEDKIAGLEEAIETLDLADLLHVQAQADAAESRAYEAESKYRALRYDVQQIVRRRASMRDRLAAIQQLIGG